MATATEESERLLHYLTVGCDCDGQSLPSTREGLESQAAMVADYEAQVEPIHDVPQNKRRHIAQHKVRMEIAAAASASDWEALDSLDAEMDGKWVLVRYLGNTFGVASLVHGEWVDARTQLALRFPERGCSPVEWTHLVGDFLTRMGWGDVVNNRMRRAAIEDAVRSAT